jgi:hypothetical protein
MWSEFCERRTCACKHWQQDLRLLKVAGGFFGVGCISGENLLQLVLGEDVLVIWGLWERVLGGMLRLFGWWLL